MLMQEERELIVEYGKKMSSTGLSRGTAGNISIYSPELQLMAISPSGVGYFETLPEDVVVMKLDGEIVDGIRKPSSEWGMHAAFYKAKQDEGCLAIVHTHSDYATTLACMGEPIRAVHYSIASSGTDLIPVAPYTTFGTPELAELAIETCKEGRAVLLGNHGLIAFHINLEKAFNLAGSLESLAKTQWQCMCAGKMNVLTREQMEKVFVRFQTYGQKKADAKGSNSY